MSIAVTLLLSSPRQQHRPDWSMTSPEELAIVPEQRLLLGAEGPRDHAGAQTALPCVSGSRGIRSLRAAQLFHHMHPGQASRLASIDRPFVLMIAAGACCVRERVAIHTKTRQKPCAIRNGLLTRGWTRPPPHPKGTRHARGERPEVTGDLADAHAAAAEFSRRRWRRVTAQRAVMPRRRRRQPRVASPSCSAENRRI